LVGRHRRRFQVARLFSIQTEKPSEPTKDGEGSKRMTEPRNHGLGDLLASYGWLGLLSLAFDVIATRVRFPKCRLVRFPIYIRGRRWIVLGTGFTCGRGLRMDAFGDRSTVQPLIRIGSNVAMNDYVHIGAVEAVTIGDRVLIASKVFISDHDHGSYGKDNLHSSPSIPPGERELSSSPVSIEDDVWIGEFVAILAGVRIGKGSIVGAMSTVTTDIPPYSIAVGSPARVVKTFNFESGEWERV
jgi:acetyltransferase-like isoleucine patch superfamily enzyme